MSATQLFKLKTTPSGKRLWTYMAAILEVTGMIKGEAFPLNAFLGNFKTHLDAQRIMRSSDGYKLSQKGLDYFNDRYASGSPQHIDRAEVEQYMHGIQTGFGTEEWIKL